MTGITAPVRALLFAALLARCSAEGYHQDYLRKHPGGYTCHFMRD